MNKLYYNSNSEEHFEDFEVLYPRQTRQSKASIFENDSEENMIDDSLDTESSDTIIYYPNDDCLKMRYLLLQLIHEQVNEPSIYVTNSVHGMKHGYGEMQFQGEYSDIVFSTRWVYDEPTYEGFIYNRSTSEVLGIVYSEWDLHLFDGQDVPTYNVIDSSDGSRWEGMCYNNIPCGYGNYYDGNDTLVYNGMCVNFVWEGFGRTVYEVNYGEYGVLNEGWWIHGEQMGEGKAYNLFGNLVVSGTMYNSQIITSFSWVAQGVTDLSATHCFLEEIIIGDNTLNTLSSLDLDLFRNLRLFSVGKQSLQQCYSFKASHLPYLQAITIGYNSFSELGTNLELLLSEMGSAHACKKHCVITHLPSLQTLSISSGAFSDYSSFTLSNVPLLEDLQLGEVGVVSCNFFFAPTLMLSNIQSIQSVSIGDFGFYYSNLVTFFKLPSLQSLRIGEACCFRYINRSGKLVLSHLPVLQQLVLLKQALVSVSSVVLSSKEASGF